MEWRQLKYFEAVASLGGFRKAARELGMTQPTLSTHVRQLEAELGVRLIERTRPVRLTRAGELVRDRARELIMSWAQLEHDLAALTDRPNALTLGTAPWAASIVPGLVAGFAKKHPEVQLRLKEIATSDEATSLLSEGDLDLSLLSVEHEVEHLPDQLRSLHLVSYDHVIAVAAEHRLARRSEIALKELAGERLVVARGKTAESFKRALAAAGVSAQVVLETTDADMVPALVARGLGIGFAADFRVARTQGQLTGVKIRDLPMRYDALLVWRNRPRNPSTEVFLQYIGTRPWARFRR